jgi:hypothetical protein
MYVFRTTKDFPHTVQILGVGTLQKYGGNVITVEKAAPAMSELSKKEDGQLVVDEQGGTTPLEGKDLVAAAKAWAEKLEGVECVELKQETIDKVNEESGALPDLTAEDALSAAQEYHDRAYGNTPDPVSVAPVVDLVPDEDSAGVQAEKGGEL